MSSSISKRYSLPMMTSEKHSLKLRRKHAFNNSDIIRSTLDGSLPGSHSFSKTKTFNSSSTKLSRSFDKLEELATNSKAIKKIASLVSSTIFPRKKYHLRQEEEKYETTEHETYFNYSSAPIASSPCSFREISSGSSFFDDDSTLSNASCDTSLFHAENILETKNLESCQVIKHAVRQTGISIQLMLADSIKSTKQSLGYKYNKILQQKQHENVETLTKILDKSARAIEEMRTVILDEIRQKDDTVMGVIDNFRTRLEDSKRNSKRMERYYEKMIKAAENKIKLQREEILLLKRDALFNQERDDILED